jgi:hypothetical protein
MSKHDEQHKSRLVANDHLTNDHTLRQFPLKVSTPKEYSSPLEPRDHTTELLDPEGIQKYQSLIGSMQWSVSIGRLDITTAVMSMSSFRAAPRKGHLQRQKRIYGYLKKFRNYVMLSAFVLQIRTPIYQSKTSNGRTRYMEM